MVNVPELKKQLNESMSKISKSYESAKDSTSLMYDNIINSLSVNIRYLMTEIEKLEEENTKLREKKNEVEGENKEPCSECS